MTRVYILGGALVWLAAAAGCAGALVDEADNGAVQRDAASVDVTTVNETETSAADGLASESAADLNPDAAVDGSDEASSAAIDGSFSELDASDSSVDSSTSADASMDAGGGAADANVDEAGEDAAVVAEPPVACSPPAVIEDAGEVADAADASVRVLQQLLSNAPWNPENGGMASDPQGNVYVADANNIYVYAGGVVNTYMTSAEAAAIPGSDASFMFQDLDTAPDGSLYIISVWGTIIHSNAPHAGTVVQQQSLSTYAPPFSIGAVTNTEVAVVDDVKGLTFFSGTASQPLYSELQISGGGGCFSELTTNAGLFLYAPRCNGSPLLLGKLDGSGVCVLMTSAMTYDGFGNFMCSARDPAGGFYATVTDFGFATSELYHIDTNATPVVVPVTTSPSFTAVEASQDVSTTLAFDWCNLAVGPDGTVFMQTESQLWSVSPP